MKRLKNMRWKRTLIHFVIMFAVFTALNLIFKNSWPQALVGSFIFAAISVATNYIRDERYGAPPAELDAILIELPTGEDILFESQARMIIGKEIVPGKVFFSQSMMVFKSIDLGDETITHEWRRVALPPFDKKHEGWVSFYLSSEEILRIPRSVKLAAIMAA